MERPAQNGALGDSCGDSVTVRGVEHLVIGGDGDGDGGPVVDRDALTSFLLASFYRGLTLNHHASLRTVVVSDPGQDQDDEMALILLRAFAEDGLATCRSENVPSALRTFRLTRARDVQRRRREPPPGRRARAARARHARHARAADRRGRGRLGRHCRVRG